MQISMRILVACVIATAVFSAPLFAQDTAAQSKAREALAHLYDQGQAQLPATNPAPVAPTVTEPARPSAETHVVPAVQSPTPSTPAQPTPVQTPEPMTPTLAPAAQSTSDMPVLVAPTPSSPDAIEKAREALRQQLAQPEAQPAPAPVVQHPVAAPTTTPGTSVRNVPPPVEPQVVTAPTPAVQTSTTTPSMMDAYEAAEQKAVAEAKAAAEKKAAEQKAHPASTSPRERAENAARNISSTLPPLQGPPTGLSPAKEGQLRALLQQYEADQITPEQYHEQRAKILAQP